VRDRYGPPPTAVLNLADFARIRVLADGLGVETIDRADATIVIKFRQKTKVDLTHVIALVQERGDLQLLPPNSLKLIEARDLDSGEPQAASPSLRAPASAAPEPRRIDGENQRKPSWWTARATTGEVTPGFTKAEILRQAPEDPPRAGWSLKQGDGTAGRAGGLRA
jgi:hypothetical protein